MSTGKERVFVVGATGYIGTDLIRDLIKRGIDTTAYVRDESKAKNLFKDELLTGQLTLVVGTYSTIDVYSKAIQGQTRLFLLVLGDMKRPTSIREIKETFGKIAYEKGVRQIVDLSSFTVCSNGKLGIIGYMHTTGEDVLWNLAEQKPDERSLVVLRPTSFMNNQFMTDLQSVKHANKLVSVEVPLSAQTWIDTKDIAECSAVILTEPIEKHDRCVYEMGNETLTHEQRAAIFSKVLGRTITYEQQSIEKMYQMFLGFGMPHAFVYNLISIGFETDVGYTTPQLSILINRPLRTMEEWLKENAQAFQ